MRTIPALISIVAVGALSTSSAADTTNDNEASKQTPRQVELVWQTATPTKDGKPVKAAMAEAMLDKTVEVPPPEVLRRVKNERGEWVIVHTPAVPQVKQP